MLYSGVYSVVDGSFPSNVSQMAKGAWVKTKMPVLTQVCRRQTVPVQTPRSVEGALSPQDPETDPSKPLVPDRPAPLRLPSLHRSRQREFLLRERVFPGN